MPEGGFRCRGRGAKPAWGSSAANAKPQSSERRQVLDSATTNVGQAADPQTIAAIRLVAWGSGGILRPAPEDFAMLRLFLLALLPQVGGLLLLVGRHSAASNRAEPVCR